MSSPPSLGESVSKFSFLKHKIFLASARVFFASIVAFFLGQMNLAYLESYLYDLRVRAAPTEPTSGLIELVLFNRDSVQALKRDLDASILSQLIKKIRTQNPGKIILNINLEEISGTSDQKKELAHTATETPHLFVVTDRLKLKGDEANLSLAPPFEKVRLASAPRTSDLKIYAKDGVTRRMLIAYQDIPLLHTEIASEYNSSINDIGNIQGTFAFADSKQVYIKFHPTGTYPQTSAIEILNSSAPHRNLENKIIIIGNDTEQNSLDYILTPYSREITAMSSTEMHANMFDTLIRNSAPKAAPEWINMLILWLMSVFTVHVVFAMSPAKGLTVLASTIFAFIITAALFFVYANLWIHMAAPLLTAFLCYYFFIPYRLIVENRRSWEYYQKNKLLSQVEELKTNFISMMSHDLKTPIARIQGMTDIILTDTVKLSSQQREAVDTIKHSSDDLLKFINAILSYGKIESQGVQLHLQSKDVNNLLHEVIRKHEFLAKVKRIQIVSELEPMFPVPIDADLMKQVFSNLIENAIKYSPEDTKILVTSEEKDSKVVVQVSDQGPGIPPDEISNIFMKFFRSKNAKSSPIKGSGLGLYLAKYFTELHHGHIFVESSHGNGSTFTVELPIDQGVPHA